MDMVQRAFLRACINRSCLDLKLIDQILTPLCEHYEVPKPANKEALYEFVSNINSTIKEMGQSLGFLKHPISDQEYLVFAVKEAAPDKLGLPGLTPEECQYFSIIFDILAQKDDLSMAWHEAYSDSNFRSSNAKPLKKLRMQALLQLWTDMGYFLESGDCLYLGPRCMIEFEFYLRSNYEDNIKECALCKKLVLWDVKCTDCNRKIHRDCIRKYLRTRSNCPTCGKKWATRLSQ